MHNILESLLIFSAGILPHVITFVLALIAGLLVFILRRKIVALLSKCLKKLTDRFPCASDIIDAAEKPAVSFFAILAGYIFLAIVIRDFFPGAYEVSNFLTMALKISLIVCITWALMNAAGPIITALQENSKLDNTIVAFLAKILKVVILVISVVIIIDEIGYNISSLITGIGLGGLVVALAAQDTASNFFGGIVIIADKPFQVGDWIESNGLEGVVSDITLRSTHIRTFKDAEIIVPNSTLANAPITNWTRMKKRKVDMTLGVTYQTSPEKIAEATEAVKEILRNHPRVHPDVIIVAFNEFNAYSLDLTVGFFLHDTAFADYIGVKSEINLQIMRKLAEIGVDFAYPTQTLLVETNK
ncbi:MAG: mechanosensitive ion channel family protein [Oscillospiraceae bacterium]|nr:mechanosensitive ion channel family protein [Oscillospiraceae bacterium]